MMETDAEQLQFVIRFAQMDLDTLRPSGWLKLREDLHAFIWGKLYGLDLSVDYWPMAGGDVFLNADPPYPREYPEDAFRVLQEETRYILHSMIMDLRERSSTWNSIPIQVGLGAPSLD